MLNLLKDWEGQLLAKEPPGAARDPVTFQTIPLDTIRMYIKPQIDLINTRKVQAAIYKINESLTRLSKDPSHCQPKRPNEADRHSAFFRAIVAHKKELQETVRPRIEGSLCSSHALRLCRMIFGEMFGRRKP